VRKKKAFSLDELVAHTDEGLYYKRIKGDFTPTEPGYFKDKQGCYWINPRSLSKN